MDKNKFKDYLEKGYEFKGKLIPYEDLQKMLNDKSFYFIDITTKDYYVNKSVRFLVTNLIDTKFLVKLVK